MRVSDEDIKNIEEIIQNSEDFEYYPPISEILQTARLVYGGYIATIKHLKLGYINLNQIPPPPGPYEGHPPFPYLHPMYIRER